MCLVNLSGIFLYKLLDPKFLRHAQKLVIRHKKSFQSKATCHPNLQWRLHSLNSGQVQRRRRGPITNPSKWCPKQIREGVPQLWTSPVKWGGGFPKMGPSTNPAKGIESLNSEQIRQSGALNKSGEGAPQLWTSPVKERVTSTLVTGAPAPCTTENTTLPQTLCASGKKSSWIFHFQWRR